MITDSPFSSYAALLREFIESHSTPGSVRAGEPRDNAFNSLASTLFALQFTHNPAYRRFCESRKATPQTIRHWREIPAIPAAGFKELELTSIPPDQRTDVFHSSGTTDQRPSRHFHNTDSLSLYEASLLPWFQAHLPHSPAERQAPHFLILTPPPGQAPYSSLVHMFDAIRRNLGSPDSIFTGHVLDDGAWQLDFDQTIIALRHSVQSQRPLALLGTAFSFVHLLDGLEQTKLALQLPSGSFALETGGYKGRSRTLPKPELHALMTSLLGIPSTRIVCEYGMSELNSQAYDSVTGQPQSTARAFHFPPWARSQIISPETGREVAEGETGLIRIFDLANVLSVMAIQTEDLGIRRGGGFELIGRAALADARGCSLMSL